MKADLEGLNTTLLAKNATIDDLGNDLKNITVETQHLTIHRHQLAHVADQKQKEVNNLALSHCYNPYAPLPYDYCRTVPRMGLYHRRAPLSP